MLVLVGGALRASRVKIRRRISRGVEVFRLHAVGTRLRLVDEGIRWARGWKSQAANALRAAVAMS